MQVEYEKAKAVFNRIESYRKCPSQDPNYVVIDANREKDLVPTFFVYEDGGEIYYHSFHVSPIPNSLYYDVQTPYGYGGPISTTEDPLFLKRAWNAYSDWSREKKIVVEFVRFHPILENWRFYQGEVFYDRDTVWIDLTTENLMNEYQTRAKRKVRKAIKNDLVVQWVTYEEFFNHFPKVYDEVMNSLQADSFYYFSDAYYKAWQTEKNVHFALCKHEEEVVATVFFYHNGSTMEYHLSAATDLGKELAATSLVIHEAALLGKQLGYKQLHLGGGTNSHTDNPLFFFKSGFSNRRGNFKIGKVIHLQAIYDQMKDEWLEKNGEITNRVLFYRS
ncbi:MULTISPECIES: GNAT family N-acetyltransferase [Brevibacillus]|jgi:Uncharacterized protein involved in methicillin resistance|uniref:GNAT family N-acetyltransferase n=1 Tax=Brevibacillus TaxID=55080 RepID=UPI00156B8C46|nr:MULTISPECIES: GNAT family N-acetyltransferase [Brevibacillus]MBU8713676.1 GNAT family N-acetyltransferase [Brevibacillus parabrevis]UED68668.1 GNAT family N-acetyltransferase [Brevibacillus sp. HD3.3A]